MVDIADVSRAGIVPAQHHDLGQSGALWPSDRLLLAYKVRVLGKNLFDTKNVLDLDTYGYDQGGAVWLNDPGSGANISATTTRDKSAPASPATGGRDVPLWFSAAPSMVSKPLPKGTTDPYGPKTIPGTFPGRGRASVGLQYKGGDRGGWQIDPGLKTQSVSFPLGQAFPFGFPGSTQSLSNLTKQEVAFIPAGGVLAAIHRGGIDREPMGSRVYDVTPEGELDDDRWARIHSSMRVYRLPTVGEVFFGGYEDPKFKAYLAPGGLAWQLGLHVGSQAGRGVVADSQASSGLPDDAPSTTTPGLGRTATGNFRTNMGVLTDAQMAALPPGTTVDSTGTLRGPPTNQGAADPFLAPSERPILEIPKTQERTPAGGNPGTRERKPGTPQAQVLASASARARGPLEVGSQLDPHILAETPDGEPINSLHLDEGSLFFGPTGDAPLKFDVRAFKQVQQGGPLHVETFLRNHVTATHPWFGKDLPGLRKWQTPMIFVEVPPPITDGGDPDEPGRPGKPKRPGRGRRPGPGTTPQPGPRPGPNDGANWTDPFPPRKPGPQIVQVPTGGQVGPGPLVVPIPANGFSPSPITDGPVVNGPLVVPIPAGGFKPDPAPCAQVGGSTMSVSMPEILARAADFGGAGVDTRFVSRALTAETIRAWAATPISGRILAFRDTTTPTIQRRAGIPCPGASDRGGFLLTPGGIDGAKVITDQAQVEVGEVGFVCGPGAYIGYGRPSKGGKVRSGWKSRRNGSTGVYEIVCVDSDGDEDSPTGFELDCGNHTTTSWGETLIEDGEFRHPPGFIDGLGPTRIGSPLVVIPRGSARSQDDLANITLAAETSVDLVSNGAALGNDSFALSGLFATTIGTNVISGTGSNLLLTEFAPRAIEASGVTYSNVSTTVTGPASARWISGGILAPKVNDLIGLSAIGYRRIVSIDSESSMTVSAVFPAAGVGGANLIESPTVELGTIPAIATRVDQIFSNSTMWTIDNAPSTAAATFVYAGRPLLGGPTCDEVWFYPWLCKGPSGVTVFLSTQRSQPYANVVTPGTYGVNFRRLGAVLNYSDGGGLANLYYYAESGEATRERQWEEDVASGTPFAPLWGADPVGGWTKLSLHRGIPPTATVALLNPLLSNPAIANQIILRQSGTGSATVNRPATLLCAAGAATSSVASPIVTSGVQAVDIGFAGASPGDPCAYLWITGYLESLAPPVAYP